MEVEVSFHHWMLQLELMKTSNDNNDISSLGENRFVNSICYEQNMNLAKTSYISKNTEEIGGHL